MQQQLAAMQKMLGGSSGQQPPIKGGGKFSQSKSDGRWAWQAGPSCSCQCDGEFAQEAPYCGLGSSGPVKTKANNRGPGWTGPAVAVGNSTAFQATKALQRRAAKGRPCSWRGGCRRRACR
eukprot:4170879-Amphidinium_carterae.1